ncbi:MAG: TolC family protein [Pseudomonadota bacterium]
MRWPLIGLGLLLFGGVAEGQPLTEDEAVESGLDRPEVRAMLEGRLDAAAGEARAAGRWSNPELEYGRDALSRSDGEHREQSLWLRQRINIVGVPGLQRQAGERRQSAEAARVEQTRAGLRATIRTRFHEALAAEARAKALADWQERLAELSRAVARRVEAGDASRYDRLRLERELARLRGRRLEADAASASARDHLFTLIGSEPRPLTGELLPPALEPVRPEAIPADPEARALAAEAEAATMEARAASRGGWPELTIGVGRREVDEPGFSGGGGQLSLGVDLPLFDRGAARADAEQARARRLRGRSERRAAEHRARVREARRTARAQRDAATHLLEATEPDESLATMAEAAYSEGAMAVTELIEAHNAELSTRLESISRSLAARRAHIQLHQLIGDAP